MSKRIQDLALLHQKGTLQLLLWATSSGLPSGYEYFVLTTESRRLGSCKRSGLWTMVIPRWPATQTHSRAVGSTSIVREARLVPARRGKLPPPWSLCHENR